MKKSDFINLLFVILLIYVLSKLLKSMTNEEQINTLHPAVRSQFVNFISDIEKMGYTVNIIEALRSIEESARLKKIDPRNATPGYSSHNYGMATDLEIKDKNGNVISKNAPRSVWVNTGIPALAINKYGMRWGGNFAGYPDNNHFDYQNKYPTRKLLSNALKQFGTMDKIIGNQVNLT